jgi:hypothetical protein
VHIVKKRLVLPAEGIGDGPDVGSIGDIEPVPKAVADASKPVVRERAVLGDERVLFAVGKLHHCLLVNPCHRVEKLQSQIGVVAGVQHGSVAVVLPFVQRLVKAVLRTVRAQVRPGRTFVAHGCGREEIAKTKAPTEPRVGPPGWLGNRYAAVPVGILAGGVNFKGVVPHLGAVGEAKAVGKAAAHGKRGPQGNREA